MILSRYGLKPDYASHTTPKHNQYNISHHIVLELLISNGSTAETADIYFLLKKIEQNNAA